MELSYRRPNRISASNFFIKSYNIFNTILICLVRICGNCNKLAFITRPFKSFFYSKALASWCASEDIFFNSEENCRVNKDLLVKAYNKKYPNDKINDKRKK